MVVDKNSGFGTHDKIEPGDDLFGATDTGSGISTTQTDEKGEYVIAIDPEAMLDTVVKSVVGGVATGLVMRGLIGE